MRLFVGIDLELGLLEGVKDVQEAIRGAGAGVKFVEPGNLHLTVKFLGEQGDSGPVTRALGDSLEGVEAFRIGIGGLAYFGSESHIRALFLDVKQGRGEMQALLDRVGRALDPFRHDSHGASPHLTIGRVRSGGNRGALLEAIGRLSHVKIGEMDVKFVKLKQSVLTEKGPVYSDVKVFELGG